MSDSFSLEPLGFQGFLEVGAGGRNRTGTGRGPRDFKKALPSIIQCFFVLSSVAKTPVFPMVCRRFVRSFSVSCCGAINARFLEKCDTNVTQNRVCPIGSIFRTQQKVCNVHGLYALIIATGKRICSQYILGIIVRNR